MYLPFLLSCPKTSPSDFPASTINWSGAVVGSPGTVPTDWEDTSSNIGTIVPTFVGTGIEGGLRYFDVKLTGTPTTGVYWGIRTHPNWTPANPGEYWSLACGVSLVAGTTTNVDSARLRMISFTSGYGVVDVIDNTFVPVRQPLNNSIHTSVSGALGAAVTYLAPYIMLGMTDLSAVDITIRVGGVNLKRLIEV